ncbi:hypothetical protein GCM10009077_20980 [Roseibium denhamense]
MTSGLPARLSGLTQQIDTVFASLWDRACSPGNVVANLCKPDGLLQFCALYPNKPIPTISVKLVGPEPSPFGTDGGASAH